MTAREMTREVVPAHEAAANAVAMTCKAAADAIKVWDVYGRDMRRPGDAGGADYDAEGMSLVLDFYLVSLVVDKTTRIGWCAALVGHLYCRKTLLVDLFLKPVCALAADIFGGYYLRAALEMHWGGQVVDR